ncbi:hypothetical protein [Pseudoalteromonas sp. S16_S37]|uniref:hypothetical protein n=1 Tax=Pseudoalteromonas sp. S16_S37 TaxID=2720228 RepID=UPI00167FF2F6|nr:hypothetical protein [Pseudoalteromonas sp. S16_S37]MBD1584929.1 hypothetical protein [Pseudoalteromonas sp. S16_S37]
MDTENKEVIGKDFLLDVIRNYFKYDPYGAKHRTEFIRFIDMHISAMERHNQDPRSIKALRTFCEDTLGLNSIASDTVRESLRLQMAWSEPKPS